MDSTTRRRVPWWFNLSGQLLQPWVRIRQLLRGGGRNAERIAYRLTLQSENARCRDRGA